MSFNPDELDLFDHETYGAVDYVGMYHEENIERLIEKRQKEYDDGIEDRKRTAKQDELYMDETIRRIRDKQNKTNKKLRDMEKRLINKEFKDDVEEYISRLNTILHTYRFATEAEYDDVIELNAAKCCDKFTSDQVFVESHYGGDDDNTDDIRPREHRIYLYNKEDTLVAMISTYVLYDGDLFDKTPGWSQADEYDCFITSMANKKAPTFLIERISVWKNLKDVKDIESYLDTPSNLQYYVSPLRNPEYTWHKY